MNKLLIVSLATLFFSGGEPTFATTKGISTGQPVSSFCQVRAKFLNASADRLKFKKRGVEQSSALVFWNLEILDASDQKICPEGKSLSLRIRGGDFSGTKENPNFTYPVDFNQPKPEEIFSVKIRLIEGRDTFTARDYKEWTFVERTND